MEEKVFYAHLAEILETPESTLHRDADLKSVGWNSLAVVSFIAFADESFGLMLEPRKIVAAKTVGDLMQLMNGNIVVSAQ